LEGGAACEGAVAGKTERVRLRRKSRDDEFGMPAAGVLLALAAVGLLAVGCGGGGGDKTFEGEGYSFTYPGKWHQVEGGGAAEIGDRVSSVTLAPSEGASGLTVNVYRLKVPVTESNIETFAPETASVTAQIFRQSGGRTTAGPKRVSAAGLPGFSAEGMAVTPKGVHVQSLVTLLFDGTKEYFLNCQFTPDQAEETRKGCDQVLGSFHVE
jgi:hypothetical protein